MVRTRPGSGEPTLNAGRLSSLLWLFTHSCLFYTKHLLFLLEVTLEEELVKKEKEIVKPEIKLLEWMCFMSAMYHMSTCVWKVSFKNKKKRRITWLLNFTEFFCLFMVFLGVFLISNFPVLVVRSCFQCKSSKNDTVSYLPSSKQQRNKSVVAYGGAFS